MHLPQGARNGLVQMLYAAMALKESGGAARESDAGALEVPRPPALDRWRGSNSLAKLAFLGRFLRIV